MISEFFDFDEFTGIKQVFHYDPDTDRSHIESIQNVENHLNFTKALANTDHQKKGAKESFMHAAHIPNVIIEKWLREYNVDIYKQEDWPKVKRLLNGEFKLLKPGDYKL